MSSTTYGQYKIRKISENNTGDNYAIAVPKHIPAEHGEVSFHKLLDIKFSIFYQNGSIIFTSGQDIAQLKLKATKFK